MKRIVAATLLLAVLVGWTAGCNKKDIVSPILTPATPSPTSTATVYILTCPTAIPTSGTCQSMSAYATEGGSAVSVYVGNSSQSPWSASGALPVGGNTGSANFYGQYVLRTASDWDSFVSTSVAPGGSYTIPFNPSTQMMLVISSTALNCCTAQTIQQICNNGSQITVYVTWNGSGYGCVSNGVGGQFYTQSIGVILPQSSLPVVWNNPCGIPPDNCWIAN